MDSEAKDSIVKLRQLRDALCKKQSEWKQAFAVKDALLMELKSLKEAASDDAVTREALVVKIDDLLVLVDPERQQEMGV